MELPQNNDSRAVRRGYLVVLKQLTLASVNGGAGNRTPVRTSIPNCLYVRRLRFEFSGGRHAAIQPLEKLPNISRWARKRYPSPA